MYADNSIGVVVPAYNEAAHIGDVLRTLPAFVDRAYVVDDGSTDDTWAVIRRHVATDPDRVGRARADGGVTADHRVVALRHDTNRGVGAAIRTGYRRALADDQDVVAVMGGDGQMDPDLLDRLVAPVAEGRADYAKGNRLVGPAYRADMHTDRYLGNRILTSLTRLASGYWRIGDPQNGYTAISADALEAIDLDRMYGFYGYCNDLLVALHVAGQRVVDVPLPATYADETSHIRYRTYVPRVSGMLLRNFIWRIVAERRATTYPIAESYLGATVLLPVAVGCLVAGLGLGMPTLAFGLAVGLLGTLSLLLGIWCDRRAMAGLGRQLAA